jgi:hypothetical protein
MAYRARQKIGEDIRSTICVYDAAEKLGLEVRFVDLPSLEGMYFAGNPPGALISSLRPAGRRRFTCAHELGHWWLDHGTTLDELSEAESGSRQRRAYEVAAQAFAGAFLAPKPAVLESLHVRGWSVAAMTPIQLLGLASLFGMGYETMGYHLQLGLRMISDGKRRELLATKLPTVRAEALGVRTHVPLHIVDSYWRGRPIDVEIGDLVLAHGDTVHEGDLLSVFDSQKPDSVFRAETPGLGRLVAADRSWAAFVRVSRAGFSGRSIFRHLTEGEIDD